MSRAFSMAMTMASRHRSMAMTSTSGFAWAVSTVNLPLPQPISTHSAAQPGFRLRQAPFLSEGSGICQGAQAAIRGSRLGFFLIRIAIPPKGIIPHIFQHLIIAERGGGIKLRQNRAGADFSRHNFSGLLKNNSKTAP